LTVVTSLGCLANKRAMRCGFIVVVFSNVIPTGFWEALVSIRGTDSRAGHVALIGFGGDALGLFAYE